MANLRANNLTGTGGRNAMKGSVSFSGYVDGTSADWLQIHDNLGDFNVGTGDFTFECWVKAANLQMDMQEFLVHLIMILLEY